MMLQENLKSSTSESHDRLEQLMFVGQIMSKSLTLEQYRQILLTNYVIHEHYEQLLVDQISHGKSLELELQNREKLAALTLDLAEAGLKKEQIEPQFEANTLPTASEAFALGAMYVLEGATLGGSVILKQLAKNPNFAAMNLHYYGCYGSQLMEKWKKFVHVLNNEPEEKHQEVIDGANWMFNEIAETAEKIKSIDAPTSTP